MTVVPPLYRLISEFNYVFHSVIDLLFIVVALLIVGTVSRPGWRHHLQWARLLAAAAWLTGCYRLILDQSHYLHFGGLTVYVASNILLYLADGASLWGTWLLWLTLRDSARAPAAPDPQAEYPAQPGVWPPAPVIK